MMTFDEMNQAVREAGDTIDMADRFVDKMARLIVGRLRKVHSGRVLAAFKKELKDFDSRNNTWLN